jgi:hypothetical protein
MSTASGLMVKRMERSDRPSWFLARAKPPLPGWPTRNIEASIPGFLFIIIINKEGQEEKRGPAESRGKTNIPRVSLAELFFLLRLVTLSLLSFESGSVGTRLLFLTNLENHQLKSVQVAL